MQGSAKQQLQQRIGPEHWKVLSGWQKVQVSAPTHMEQTLSGPYC
jgi:hypothetical protein